MLQKIQHFRVKPREFSLSFAELLYIVQHVTPIRLSAPLYAVLYATCDFANLIQLVLSPITRRHYQTPTFPHLLNA